MALSFLSVLQAGTSHNLGQNFSKAFDTTFLDENQKTQHVYQSSWGVSTRLVGGVIMTHGDDTGLRLPPALAPVQVSDLSQGSSQWPVGSPPHLRFACELGKSSDSFVKALGREPLLNADGKSPGVPAQSGPLEPPLEPLAPEVCV